MEVRVVCSVFSLFLTGGDDQEIGRIGYLIGNKYDFYGDQDSAVKYHAEYYELCKSTNNETGMGKACQALAVANKRYQNTQYIIPYSFILSWKK